MNNYIDTSVRQVRVFSYVGGVSIEIFAAPFFQKTRDLANGCFASYARNHNGRDLNWDTPDGNTKATELLLWAAHREIREAVASGDFAWAEEVEAILRVLPLYEYGARALLYHLAWDGGGYRPLGALFDWAERFERAMQQNADAIMCEVEQRQTVEVREPA